MSLLLAITLTVSTSGEAVPRKGPYLSDLSATAVEVRWETDGAPEANGLVLDTGGSWTMSEPVRVEGGLARSRIDELTPDRSYGYRVRLGEAYTARQSFRTLSPAGSPVRFLVYGDTRSNHAVHARIASRMAAESPDFAVNTGDLVGDGRVAELWQPFFEAERALFAVAPVFAAVGNHDARGLFNDGFYGKYFSTGSYYEKRSGPVRIFFVDSNQSYSTGSRQHLWLVSRLAAARAEIDAGEPGFLIAVHHYPAFSSGSHGDTGTVKRELVPLYERYGVTAVFTGHDHLYERLESAGVTYFVTGGGGAPLYDSHPSRRSRKIVKAHHYVRVDANDVRMRVEGVDLDGNVIDSVDLAPLAGRESGPPPTFPAHAASAALFALTGVLAWVTSGRVKR